MSTVVIIALIALIVIVAAGALYAVLRRGVRGGGGGLRRRFGPEYERVLTRHNGDTKAAHRELGERVRRYGGMTPHPLAPERHEQYLSHWTAAQERFVDSPRQALTEARELLGALASERGFPGPEHHDEHLDALSVHHATHVDAYRRLHTVATGEANTEEMRAAMLQARALFDALAAQRNGTARRESRAFEHATESRNAPSAHGERVARRPLFTERRHLTKGSEAS